jgi:hypothetical protein
MERGAALWIEALTQHCCIMLFEQANMDFLFYITKMGGLHCLHWSGIKITRFGK